MIRAIVTAALLVAATASYAQELDLGALDTDGNGTISMAEAKVAMPDLSEEDFAAADADASGELDAEELIALSE